MKKRALTDKIVATDVADGVLSLTLHASEGEAERSLENDSAAGVSLERVGCGIPTHIVFHTPPPSETAPCA